jgi:hypothetical protein
MRMFAVHDSGGTILQVITGPDNVQGLTLETPAGLYYTEVDPPEQLPDDEDGLDEFVSRFMASHRVDSASPRKASVVAVSDAPASPFRP